MPVTADVDTVCDALVKTGQCFGNIADTYPIIRDADAVFCHRDAKMQALVADTPLKRFGMPDEVAAIAVMLASDEATYVTGTEVSIDGGLLAGSAASPG
nr:hypothetical protein [uncultured organism]